MSEQETNTTGGCQCGAVRFTLKNRPTEYGACHCKMCRKLGGGVALTIMVPPGAAAWSASDRLTTYPSSDWAERGFCATCGSNLFWRLRTRGHMHGLMYMSLGALDDATGIPFKSEVYIDHKLDSYDFAGDRRRLTEADVIAMVAGDG